jgi:hypothetical protein
MNLLTQIQKAKAGKVLGAVTASTTMNMHMGGINPGEYIVVAAEQKVGKSIFCMEFFIASLLELNPDIDLEFNIVSTEMPRYVMEARFLSRKIFKDYNIALSTDYLLGRKLNPDGSRVTMLDEHYNIVERIVNDYIEPLSGKFDEAGNLLYKGKINWIAKQNPTGIRNELLRIAETNGVFNKVHMPFTENNVTRMVEKIVGYTPNNSNKLVINLIDHIRQLPLERGFSLKQNVDKMSEYIVELNNACGFVSVAVVHLNRWISMDLLKYHGDSLHPTSEHLKETSNLGEDASCVITLMDPSDAAYKLNRHKGYDFVEFNKAGSAKYRSFHIVENRYGSPADGRLGFVGAANHFYELK